MSTSPSDRVILGVAVGYDAAQLKPFVMSLKETGYDGDLVFLISEAATKPDTRKTLESWGAEVLPFESWRFSKACVHLARYDRYYEFLSDRPYERIMLTDTRDVVFQRDPFGLDLPDPGDVAFFLEEPRVPIGKCEWNANWVKRSFGMNVLYKLFSRTISCSGITMGRRDGILRYLRTMLEMAREADPASLDVDGIDQGIHNVLIYTDRMPGFRLVENRVHVNTMGYLPTEAVSLADDGTVVNEDGSVSAVLHQYDYEPHRALHDILQARYA